MKQTATIILVLVVALSMASFPAKLYGASDDYETLEFFLDQSLKRTKDPGEKAEILSRYLIKALGLLYKQNKELIRLQHQTLGAMKELREIERKEAREMEIQMQKKQ